MNEVRYGSKSTRSRSPPALLLDPAGGRRRAFRLTDVYGVVRRDLLA